MVTAIAKGKGRDSGLTLAPKASQGQSSGLSPPQRAVCCTSRPLTRKGHWPQLPLLEETPHTSMVDLDAGSRCACDRPVREHHLALGCAHCPGPTRVTSLEEPSSCVARWLNAMLQLLTRIRLCLGSKIGIRVPSLPTVLKRDQTGEAQSLGHSWNCRSCREQPLSDALMNNAQAWTEMQRLQESDSGPVVGSQRPKVGLRGAEEATRLRLRE